jgi:hypothetical protein
MQTMLRTGRIMMLGAALLALSSAAGWAQTRPLTGHPRLYFTAEELAGLRAARAEGERARIWKNIAESADWCLTRKVRTAWIAPVAPDPIY